MFIFGLKKEIKVQTNGGERALSMREVVEEYLVPVINKFEEKDRKEAEKILNL